MCWFHNSIFVFQCNKHLAINLLVHDLTFQTFSHVAYPQDNAYLQLMRPVANTKPYDHTNDNIARIGCVFPLIISSL